MCKNPPNKDRRPTANQSGEAIKIISQRNKVKKQYIKSIQTPARVGYAPPVWKRDKIQGPTNNQRGRGSWPCLFVGSLKKTRHIVPTALLVRVQCFRKDLYRAVEGPNTKLIDLSIITGSYFRRLRRLTIFKPDETKLASHLTLLRLDHRRKPGARFLQKHILETIFHQLTFKVQSMT